MTETVEATDLSGDIAALLWLVAAGDQVAFQRLYQLYGAALYTVALRITGSSELATEVVHATLIQLWRNTIRFEPQGETPESWLIALVRSRAIDLMRRRQRDGAGLDSASRTIDPDADIARLAQSPDPAARRLHTALSGLDRDGRLLLVMTYLDGLSHAEIAQRMRLPIGTVKSWVRRSLEVLRNGLEAQR